MKQFNELIQGQMQTMEQMLNLQTEIERCQELEQELIEHQEKEKLESLKSEISQMKKELNKIHKIFESQTDDVIRQYQEFKVSTEGALT
ncbi:YgaB family protein [Heyndrickxia sp. NPDC080065]|uniref:YgaB family protein n=1 Tax=Heyndrickxia sp. NPDC080065 TaxID=3390568 RepID=UPI003D08520C